MTHSPCKRDCPNRSAECHGNCEDYKVFELIHSIETQNRRKEIEGRGEVEDYLVRNCLKTKKTRTRR